MDQNLWPAIWLEARSQRHSFRWKTDLHQLTNDGYPSLSHVSLKEDKLTLCTIHVHCNSTTDATAKSSFMRIILKIVLLLSAVAIVNAKRDGTTADLILSMHNNLRAQVSQGKLSGQPKARNLLPLAWDNKLANLAEKLAKTCVFHYDGASLPEYGRLGQNIAANFNAQNSDTGTNFEFEHPSSNPPWPTLGLEIRFWSYRKKQDMCENKVSKMWQNMVIGRDSTAKDPFMRIILKIVLWLSAVAIVNAKRDQTTADQILSMHNNLRAQVSQGKLSGQPKAKNLPPLAWENKLANLAEKLAKTCVFHHDGASLPEYGRLGQNIAANVNAQKGVQSWIDEYKSYNYTSNTCKGVCGHYTQMVASRSKKIGCAVVDCTGKWAYNYFIVCNYAPAVTPSRNDSNQGTSSIADAHEAIPFR
ncbi:unnamed protein product [Calicophoron daubneyi]|uniref:SCP domain-containing protein n=1 Tax=Calicophoron daubneyi TaxID=300641 RepID=A0AAV2T4U3_CALDB